MGETHLGSSTQSIVIGPCQMVGVQATARQRGITVDAALLQTIVSGIFVENVVASGASLLVQMPGDSLRYVEREPELI